MGYLWSYSLGVKRELMPNLGLSVDYVGNRGRNQSTQIDISEGPRRAERPHHAPDAGAVRSDRRR